MWKRGLQDMVPLNNMVAQTYDALLASGPEHVWSFQRSSMTIGFSSGEAHEKYAEGLREAQALGQQVNFNELNNSLLRSDEMSSVTTLPAEITDYDQAYVHPQRFLSSLSGKLLERGGNIRTGVNVLVLSSTETSVSLQTSTQQTLTDDAAIVANGTWFNQFRQQLGIRSIIQSGRGYSFSASIEKLPDRPVYFPMQRIACTPFENRPRVAGVMDFEEAEAAPSTERMQVLASSVAKLLPGLDVDSRTDEWIGSRP